MGKRTGVSSNKICFAMVLERLLHGDPASEADLIELTGYTLYTIRELLEVLSRRNLIYIIEWRRRGLNNQWVAHYSLNVTGDNKDARKPRHRTAAERTKAYRYRQKMLKEANVLIPPTSLRLQLLKESNEI